MEPERLTSNDLLAVQEALQCREPLLHRLEFGTTRMALESMLAPEFWETGASGKRYSREFVIDTMIQRYAEKLDDDWRTQDFYCQQIAPQLYLLSYTLHQGERVTRRTTLWRRQGDQWVAFYHQGTIVEMAER